MSVGKDEKEVIGNISNYVVLNGHTQAVWALHLDMSNSSDGDGGGMLYRYDRYNGRYYNNNNNK